MLRKTHTPSTPCHHVHLARSGVGDICYCPDCGVVHVALQYFTMRFELEAFKALQTLLNQAQHVIAQQMHSAPTVAESFSAANGDGPCNTVVH